MKLDDDCILTALARKSLAGKIQLTTSLLADECKVSQQTISRKLRDLEKCQYINRLATTSGISVSLTEKGRTHLYNVMVSLQKIFANKNVTLTGELQKGMGEGKYYMSMKGYKLRFKKMLGFEPYQGTLNLKILPEEYAAFLLSLEPIEILGFETKQRTYGGIICYKVKIKNTAASLIKPVRTRHSENIIEIIAPIYLRGKYNLKDGDRVTLHI